MSRAAKDTLGPTPNELTVADAETLLEKSLEGLHYAVSQVVFWTSVSFRFTGTTLYTASEGSQLVLSSLDQLFGSTDSSRAVASIITLIRREFRSPATGLQGEKVGVLDLTLALSTLAYLQQSCRKTAEEEARRQAQEEIIWDVVVLNDGERIDVDEGVLESIQGGYTGSPPDQQDASPSPPRSPWHDSEDDEAVLSCLKSQIMATLSPGTSVSVSNSVSSVQTITVDVEGPQLLSIPTPPGAEIVETRALTPPVKRRSWMSFTQDDEANSSASYRVVYKIERNKYRATSFKGEADGSSPAVVELTEGGFFSTDRQPLHAQPAHQSPRSSSSSSPDSSLPTIAVRRSSTGVGKTRSPSLPRTSTRGPVSAMTKNTTEIKSPSSPKSPATNRFMSSSAGSEATANQKRPRAPLSEHRPAPDTSERGYQGSTATRKPPTKRKPETPPLGRPTDKKTGLKQAIKDGGQSISSMWSKDAADASGSSNRVKQPQRRAPDGAATHAVPKRIKSPDPRLSNPPIHRDPTNRRSSKTPDPLPRSSSRTSYVSIHDRRRNSLISLTDAYSSLHQGGSLRPASPTVMRTDFATNEFIRPRADSHLTEPRPLSPGRHHRRARSYVPSVYSLATNGSQASLVLSSYYQKSAYNTDDALKTLRREGFVDGTFPSGRLLPNITRYMRYSSACYGSNFLKLLGISNDMPKLQVWDGTHHDVRHFVHHTESQAHNILLASFVDPQGGSDSSGSTETGVPLVHYISLDHDAKAVVLACRGTMGFEDVLADLSCDYDRLGWRGRGYRVHKGIHASARRLLYGGDGRVLVTLKEALLEFPDYGLVLCGHSLGAGVTSLLGVMLSEPNPDGPGFVTSADQYMRLLAHDAPITTKLSEIRLPAGRRIHVYAYGPPGVMSSSLRKITRGLITTVVHGNDIVPHLSLGLLHDFQALSLSFKRGENNARTEIRQRIWHAFQDNMSDRWYPYRNNATSKAAIAPGDEEERWMLPALEGMRASMAGEKLLPPGEVFTVESQRVLRRDAFLLVDDEAQQHIGRPAQRVVLKYVRDVEARFGEVRFGTSMLTDHSPAKYEDALNKLRLGVAE